MAATLKSLDPVRLIDTSSILVDCHIVQCLIVLCWLVLNAPEILLRGDHLTGISKLPDLRLVPLGFGVL